MADREIRLVGSFKDDITPKLKKLTREIDAVTKSFTKMQSKLRPIARDMGTLAMASERVAQGMKAQRSSMEANIRAMQQYKTTVGQVARAQRAIKPTVLPTPRPPAAPRGIPAAAPQVGGGGGGGMAAGAFGVTLGSTLSNVMTNAIVRGFQIGVGLMQKPFQYFGRAFAERIDDEMSDIQSAGGMFALDQKNAEGQRLFKGFADARSMQERLNRSLATSAAALPGATNDYVRAARGLTDTVMMAFGKNQQAFKGFAEELGARKGATSEEALTKVLQRFTEQTVLLGQGSRGGMPLTMLMEQLITKEQVNIQGMKQRYVQLRDNPLLASMLEEAQADINATAVGSAERFKAVMKALDRALPQEVINAMRMSASGIQESIRSAFLDPDTGLLGLGRELNVAVSKTNDFGQELGKIGDKEVAVANTFVKNGKKFGYVLDQYGKATDQIVPVVMENTTLFKIIRDVLGGFATPLAELASFLPTLFDPLQAVAESFVQLREVSMQFLANFTKYTNFFKEQEFEDAGARGSLAAINKLLRSLGAIDKAEALTNAKFLETKGSDLGGIAQRLLKQLFSSDLMRQIGEALGKAIGSVLSSIAAVLGGATDMANAGPFAKGFKDGFTAAGGQKAIATIFKSIFKLMAMGILELFKAAPLEASIVAGLVLFGPAIAAAVGTALVGAIPRLMASALRGGGAAGVARGVAGVQGPMQTASGTRGLMAGAAARRAGQQTTGALSRVNQAVAPRMAAAGQAVAARAPGVAKAAGAAKGALGAVAQAGKMKGVGILAAGAVKMATVSPQLAKVGKSLAGIGRNIPGLNVAFAGLDFAARKAAGEDTAKAAAGAGGGLAGGIIGGAIGTAILPGVGTAIGGVLGNMLGGWVGEKLPGMMKGVGDSVGPAVQGAWTGMTNFFTQTIPQGWNAAMSYLSGILPAAWTAVVNFFTQTLPAAWTTVVNFVTQALSNAWTGFVSFLQSIPGLLMKGFDNLIKFWTQDVPFAISFAIGFALQTIQNIWNGLVQFFTVTLPAAWTAAVNFAKMALQMAWNGIVTFFTVTLPAAWSAAVNLARNVLQTIWNGIVTFFTVTLPAAWTAAITFVQTVLSTAWNAVVAFFFALPGLMAAAWAALVAWAKSLPATIGGAFMAFISYVSTIPGQVLNALRQVGTAIIDWAKGIPGRVLASLGAGFKAGQDAAKPKYNGKGRSMPLGQAIATEMKHKPPGSSLVIANSSETVIPAYKGLNMGAAAMINGLKAQSAAGGFGTGGNNISMSDITINVNGANKNGEEIAEEVAAHLLTAMYKASYSNDGRQG